MNGFQSPSSYKYTLSDGDYEVLRSFMKMLLWMKVFYDIVLYFWESICHYIFCEIFRYDFSVWDYYLNFVWIFFCCHIRWSSIARFVYFWIYSLCFCWILVSLGTAISMKYDIVSRFFNNTVSGTFAITVLLVRMVISQ